MAFTPAMRPSFRSADEASLMRSYVLCWRMFPHALMRLLIGCVLLFSAASKASLLLTSKADGWTAPASILTTALILIELTIAVWVICRPLSPALWLVTVGFFTVLLVVSARMAFSGFKNCGCFGRIPISPWIVSGFDLVIVLMLFSLKGRIAQVWSLPLHKKLLASTAFIISLSWAFPLIGMTRSWTDGTRGAGANLVVLHPEQWVGGRFPLADEINFIPSLDEGRWVIVLYHHDCDVCTQVIPRLDRLAADWKTQPGSPRVVLVEMPPFASGIGDPRLFVASEHARLNETREWFVKTPVAAVLNQGRVLQISTGPDVADWIDNARAASPRHGDPSKAR